MECRFAEWNEVLLLQEWVQSIPREYAHEPLQEAIFRTGTGRGSIKEYERGWTRYDKPQELRDAA